MHFMTKVVARSRCSAAFFLVRHQTYCTNKEMHLFNLIFTLMFPIDVKTAGLAQKLNLLANRQGVDFVSYALFSPL